MNEEEGVASALLGLDLTTRYKQAPFPRILRRRMIGSALAVSFTLGY